MYIMFVSHIGIYILSIQKYMLTYYIYIFIFIYLFVVCIYVFKYKSHTHTHISKTKERKSEVMCVSEQYGKRAY